MSGLVYGLLWVLFNATGRLFFRYRVSGREHIPRTGGVLVAANHASYLDIPFLACGIPRRVAFLGRHDLFPVPGLKWVLRRIAWIPIRLDRLDRKGFEAAIGLIEEGNVVAIYPEGGRTWDGSLRPGKLGIGFLVASTGCPVVPAYLAGTREVLPIGSKWIRLHPVRAIFGEPIDFTAASHRYTGKDLYRHVSRTVMSKIAELGRVPPPDDSSTQDPAARPLNAE